MKNDFHTLKTLTNGGRKKKKKTKKRKKKQNTIKEIKIYFL